MKNIKFLLVLVLSAILVSCGQENVSEKTAELPEAVVTKTPSKSTIESPVAPYSNPAIIYGSSFGEFFQMLYKTGKFEDMVKFTSSQSLELFGREKVIGFYKSMDFGYKIDLKSMNKDVDIITLNYEADILATKNIVRMEVVIENDSCKILLKDIKDLR